MTVAAATDITGQREDLDQQRYEAYQAWERRELGDPRFASTRMLVDDVRNHGRILDETWERFDVEERTWGAEVLNAPHMHVDRFRVDGNDIIVKESDGVNPRLTLRDVYQNGLDITRADVAAEPGLAFQLRRDELFMEFYEAIELMMRDHSQPDTIHMISTCPSPDELGVDHDEATRLLRSKFYDLENRKSFDYTARRLPDGRLELSATRLDSSDVAAHAAVLQSSGYDNVSFALLTSHEFGRFLSRENTTSQPIEVVAAGRAAVYDAAMERATGQVHKFGRIDDSVDAHEFFRDHTEDYWAGYKAFNELLALHLGGRDLAPALQGYLLKCLDGQERVGQSVLSQEKIDRLRVQLAGGKITADMALSCRELLVYDHHATITRLYRQFAQTGEVDQLDYEGGGGFMDAYADAASSNGTEAAANGETFAGCETATGVSGLSAGESGMGAAVQLASQLGVSLEQAMRMQAEEAAHCLRIQLYGYTIRRDVHCPFCEKTVDARDSTAAIECLDDECRMVLNKATGEAKSRLDPTRDPGDSIDGDEGLLQAVAAPKLQSGRDYELGGRRYRRTLLTVVGGAQIQYTDEAGQHIKGAAAQQLEAIIVGQIAAESQAA
ncbi:MAG TPA: hypothetical protein VJM46_01115 [Candidatus Saccharimonadales bacterium]|nr:hypothetical protein [Candidatus Saccharimonadales bacterium]